MSNLYEIGEVKHSHLFDVTFLNPFKTLIKNNKKIDTGTRFGYAQLIYILCAVISLLLIGFLSDDINKVFILVSLVIYYIFLYYNLSCYLIPDNHERCFILAWICIISILFITLIVLFHRNIFYKSNKSVGGRHCKKNKKKYNEEKGGENHSEETLNKFVNYKGSGNCNNEEKVGGRHCKKNKKKYNEEKGGKNHS